MLTLIPQHLPRHWFDRATAVIVAGYAVVLASLLISLASGNWEWLQSSGCVLSLCGWYLEIAASGRRLARVSFVLGSLLWSYTTLLVC